MYGETTDADSDGVLHVCDACPNTIAGMAVDASGCAAPIFGDANRDGDVDADDLESFLMCCSSPGVAYGSGCESFDEDADGDVDQDDFGIFQRFYSGRDRAGDPSCTGL